MKNIREPIGLVEAVKNIKKNCLSGAVYKKFKIKPPHVIFRLNDGQGRSRLVEYMTDMYEAAQVLDFSSGLDPCLEFKLSGTYDDFRRFIKAVEDAAVFRNEYTGIIALDITALYNHRQESQWSDFWSAVKEISKYAYLVFFVSKEDTKCNNGLIGEIKRNIFNVEEVAISDYTVVNYADIIKQFITDIDDSMVFSDEANETLVSVCSSITDIKGAQLMADSIVRNFDLSTNDFIVTGDTVTKSVDDHNFGGAVKHEK